MKLLPVKFGAMALVLGVAVTAQAAQGNGTVRTAQMRLNDMGYYTGKLDGVLGVQTRSAILSFQRQYGLAETGKLDGSTANLISNEYGRAHAYNYGVDYRYQDQRVVSNYHRPQYSRQDYYAPNAQYGWTAEADVKVLPLRFGELSISGSQQYNRNHYMVALNGLPVLYANDQPSDLRLSDVFSLSGEDAVIISAYEGTGTCRYQHYLISVKANGTYMPAQAIGNCNDSYKAKVDGNRLYVTFSNDRMSYGKDDIWSYSNNRIERVNTRFAGL